MARTQVASRPIDFRAEFAGRRTGSFPFAAVWAILGVGATTQPRPIVKVKGQVQ